jgi:hypothetical protein
MTIFARAAAGGALLLALGACQVTVDNKTQAQLDNAGDKVDAGVSKAGDVAANAADQLGNAVEKEADKIGNGVSVHVNLHGNDDNKSSGNGQ